MKIKKVLKYLGIGIFIIILLVTSELIYIYKNRSDLICSYYFWQAKNLASAYFPKSIKNLEKSVFYCSQANQDTKSKLPPIQDYYLQTPSSNGEFKSAYLAYMSGNTDKSIVKSLPILAKNYYLLGLIAYENNETDSAIKLFQTSAYLDPELSYYFVELANIYLSEGIRDKAEGALNLCFRFDVPGKHCLEYKTNNLDNSYPLEVGIFRELIEAAN